MSILMRYGSKFSTTSLAQGGGEASAPYMQPRTPKAPIPINHYPSSIEKLGFGKERCP